jgi:hypothetical protein
LINVLDKTTSSVACPFRLAIILSASINFPVALLVCRLFFSVWILHKLCKAAYEIAGFAPLVFLFCWPCFIQLCTFGYFKVLDHTNWNHCWPLTVGARVTISGHVTFICTVAYVHSLWGKGSRKVNLSLLETRHRWLIYVCRATSN